MRIDVHQHVWTPELRAALARRDRLPLIREENELCMLHSAGEHPYVIDTDAEDAAVRTSLLDHDGLDLALIAISSPIGIEALPRAEALPLIDAQLRGVAGLGSRFAAWGPLLTDRPRPEDVDRLADAGVLGVSLTAGALESPDRLAPLAAALRRIAELELPLFIHPGRAFGDPVPRCELDEPLWWRALTSYVNGMAAAWLTWATHGRREHPELRVVFAMLAGGGPLQHERLATRGGPPIDLRDPHTFYDVSSYGEDGVEAVARVVGHDRLLFGSDRPVLEPLLTGRDAELKLAAEPLFAPASLARHVRAGGPSAPGSPPSAHRSLLTR
jgi:6-methylsalicylate decarboxylase